MSGGIEDEQTIKDANARFAELVEATSAANAQYINRNTIDTLKRSIDQIKETLHTIKSAAEVTTLSVEGQITPDRILSGMTNRGISKMFDYLTSVYGAFFINEITINSELQILKRSQEGERKVETGIEIKMMPLYSFIEAGFTVGEVPTKAVRVVFHLDTSVNVSKLELKITPENKVEVNLEDVVVHLQLLLHRINPVGIRLPVSVGSGGRILGRQVNLVKREFRLDK